MRVVTQTIESISRYVRESVGIFTCFQPEGSIHMRTLQKTAFNATGGKKPLITATALILFAPLHNCLYW